MQSEYSKGVKPQSINQSNYPKAPEIRTKKPKFNLSHDVKYTADMGQLFPVMVKEAVPGDVWKIGHAVIVRTQPMLAAIMHQVSIATYTFFVPNRILDTEYEGFITRGVTGNTEYTLPEWTTAGADPADTLEDLYAGKLWDAFGLPVTSLVEYQDIASCRPLVYPKNAYNLIYNEYFRNPDVQSAVSLDQEEILNRNWLLDYFTNARPFAQRGTAPVLPVSNSWNFQAETGVTTSDGNLGIGISNVASPVPDGLRIFDSTTGPGELFTSYTTAQAQTVFDTMSAIFENENVLESQSVDINDLRLAFQIQRWRELSMKGGSRFIENLRTQFGAAPTDERLSRPEYIGGMWKDLYVSEVLQTGALEESELYGVQPTGKIAGHGIALASEPIGIYRVQEPGWIITLCCVIPKANYQGGIERQFLKKTTFDYSFPVLAKIGDQEIFDCEIQVKPDTATQLDVFGYQGRFDDLRYAQNRSVTGMREDFAFWHLGRIFDPESPPTLSDEFLKCVPRKDIFPVTSEPALFVDFGNHLTVARPIPLVAEPYSLGV